MKFTIRCKGLQEIERHNSHTNTVEGSIAGKSVDFTTVIMANFQSHKDYNLDCYLGIDSVLIDDNLKVGDVYEVEIRKLK